MDDCLHAVGWCHCEPQVAPAQADVDAMFQTAQVAPEPEQPEPECDCLVPWLDGFGQHSPGCAIFRPSPAAPQVAPEPERCPTCGSDDPKRLLPQCQYHYQTTRYDNEPDPWHRTTDTERCPTCKSVHRWMAGNMRCWSSWPDLGAEER